MFRYELAPNDKFSSFIIELKDNQLYLDYIDDQCRHLLNMNHTLEEAIPLKTILSKERYERLYEACSMLGPKQKMIKIYEGILCSNPIQCSITYIEDPQSKKTLFFGNCSDSSSNTFDSWMDDKIELKNAYYDATFDVIFTLQLTEEGKLLISNYNQRLVTYLGWNDSTSTDIDISLILPAPVVDFFVENVDFALKQGIAFSRVLSYECRTPDIKNYLTPSNHRFNILTIFLPLNKHSDHRILCCCRDISSEIDAKKQTNELLKEYDALFSATANAVAIYRCTDSYQPVLEKQNSHMRQLKKDFFSNDIENLYTTTWEKVIQTKEIVEDTLTMEYDGKVLYYKVVMIPILHHDLVVKIIISMINTTDHVDACLHNAIKLTNREEEIVSYVINGYKNDFIANKLCISVGTVKRTLSNAYNKLGVSSRVELIKYYHSKYNDTSCQT